MSTPTNLCNQDFYTWAMTTAEQMHQVPRLIVMPVTTWHPTSVCWMCTPGAGLATYPAKNKQGTTLDPTDIGIGVAYNKRKSVR
jgi:hypothetical protein